ncbi:putative thiol:disulfide interchange protein DsbC [Comamonadaceae bacterium OS-1]|nr:putative thiol:disulfide interchange protein DsbC [Comamonadaceae bacterium OS-1]
MTFLKIAAATAIAMACLGAQADEAALRKNLAERIPQMPKIEEVNKSAMPGLFELTVSGGDIMYTDAEGNFLIQGNLIDTKARRNLTEERIAKLSAVDFDSLPSKDAFTIVRGNGKRKIAVFEDPNCGYCKRFEKDLQKVDNVTISLYLYPILSADSTDKSRNIWCAKDKAKAWQDWMLRSQTPAQAAASCDAPALARNVEFGRKYRITGTPTLLFADGSRIPGAVPVEQVEAQLAKIK